MNDLEELERQSVGWAQIAVATVAIVISFIFGFLLVSWVALHA